MQNFDPFNDRQARDIRNGLSREFLKIIGTGSRKNLLGLSSKFLSEDPAPVYRDYITARVEAYGKALQKVIDEKITDSYHQALILWDLGLFFEVHEQIESLWINESGLLKQALQGLIRAAGSFVHLEAGHMMATGKMAKKAVGALEAYGNELPAVAGRERVVAEIIEKVKKNLRQG